MRRRGRRSIIWKILGLLLVVILAYAAVLAVSMADLKNDTDAATDTYMQLETSLKTLDIEQSIACVHDLADRIDTIENKMNGWQWQVASHIPVLSDDVRCLRGIAHICDALANDALMPVLTEGETIVDNISSIGDNDKLDIIKAKAIFDEFVHLSDDIAVARDVVSNCQQEAEALPTSHFAELNDLADQIRLITTQIDETFDTLESFNPMEIFGNKQGS